MIHVQAFSRRPDWVRVDRLLGEWGMAQDSVADRRKIGAQMEARRAGERDGEFKAVRQDWYLGGEEFGPELLAQVAEKRGDWHYGVELAGSDEARAERMIGVELQRKSLTN